MSRPECVTTPQFHHSQAVKIGNGLELWTCLGVAALGEPEMRVEPRFRRSSRLTADEASTTGLPDTVAIR